MDVKVKYEKRKRRQKRVRAKIFGTKERPRLSIFRSAKHVYAQLIDDEKGKVIVSASDVKSKQGKKTKTEQAREVGRLIAQKAKELSKPLERAVFDKGSYKYHGRIKAAADGAREGGLKF